LAERPRVLVIRMRGVTALDSTGMHVLRDVVRRSKRSGTVVLLADVQLQPQTALAASGTLVEIGSENVYPEIGDALVRARQIA
jgi:SulP family sulfate permease